MEDIKEDRQDKIHREQISAIVSIVMAVFIWITNSRVVRLFLKPMAYAYGGVALGFVLEFYQFFLSRTLNRHVLPYFTKLKAHSRRPGAQVNKYAIFDLYD